MNFLSDNGGEDYNLCHCIASFLSLPSSSWLIVMLTVWSNFEIADMNFWRGPAYTAYFDYLDSTGGFYYEVSISCRHQFCDDLLKWNAQRWGDAPVHSIAAALFTKKEQIHFWDEIGYEHPPYTHCPQKEETWRRQKCTCGQDRNFGTVISLLRCFFFLTLKTGRL